MTIAGISPDASLVEAVEYDKNDFYIGVQYHPEFKSRPNAAHPVFRDFVRHAVMHHEKQAETPSIMNNV